MLAGSTPITASAIFTAKYYRTLFSNPLLGNTKFTLSGNKLINPRYDGLRQVAYKKLRKKVVAHLNSNSKATSTTSSG